MSLPRFRLSESEWPPLSMLLSTRLLAIDSSSFGRLASDYYSPEEPKRVRANRFIGTLTEAGAIPVLTYHHLEELLQHENDSVAQKRLLVLRQFPTLAWVRSFEDANRPGMIIDLHAFEAAAIIRGKRHIEDIVAEVGTSLIRYTPGTSFVDNHFEELWGAVRPHVRSHQRRKLEIESIAHVGARDNSDMTIAEFTKGKLRSPEEAAAVFRALTPILERALRERGDERLSDPSKIAEDFHNSVLADGLQAVAEGRNPVLDYFLAAGIDLNAYPSNTKFSELHDALIAHTKLTSVCDCANLSSEDRKLVAQHLPPSLVLYQQLSRAMRSELRTTGSNIVDRSLACLALYTDHVQTDKRVKEFFRQVARRFPEFRPYESRVVKCPNYEALLEIVLDSHLTA